MAESAIVIDGRYIQDHFPGIGRYTYNLVDALARIAPSESFAVLHNAALVNTRYEVGALAKYPNVELRDTSVPTFSVREQLQLPLTPCRLLHSPYFLMPYLSRIPSVVTIHDLIPLRCPQDFTPAQRIVFHLAIRLAVAKARRVIAVSQATANDLCRLLRVPAGKIVVIHEAADARFQPRGASEVSGVRAKYALPERYILSVGINKPHKNLGTLISARERAASDGGLVIAGAWDERYACEIESREAEGKSRIQWIRNIDDADLPALYTGAALFVYPSLYEGFGLPLLEAMACGVPVLAARTSSLPEVGGDAALYFDPRDADALASLITRVLDDGGARDDLRAKARGRAAQFSWEKAAGETLAVYRQLTREPN